MDPRGSVDPRRRGRRRDTTRSRKKVCRIGVKSRLARRFEIPHDPGITKRTSRISWRNSAGVGRFAPCRAFAVAARALRMENEVAVKVRLGVTVGQRPQLVSMKNPSRTARRSTGRNPSRMTTSAVAASLLDAIRSRKARTGVVGLGYVGLPLAVEFAKAGYTAIGMDLDAAKVTAINEGRSYIDDVSSKDIGELAANGRLRATTDFDVVRELDTVNICVPDAAAQDQGPRPLLHRRRGRGNRPAPATRACWSSSNRRPIRARPTNWCCRFSRRSGLKAAKDFFLAFSPERVDPGNPTYGTHNVPKVVGGLTDELHAHWPSALYQAGDRHDRPGQLAARRRDGQAAGEHLPRRQHRPGQRTRADVRSHGHRRVGSGARRPRPSRSASCRSTRARAWAATASRSTRSICRGRRRQTGFEARFIELAGAVNGSMPHYVVVADHGRAEHQSQRPLNGSRVLVAGVAYKRDVDDIRESPSLDLLGLLQARGADAVLHRSARSDARRPQLAGSASISTHVDLPGVPQATTTASSSSPIIRSSTTTSVQRVGEGGRRYPQRDQEAQPHVIRLGASNLHVAAEPAFV